MKAVVFDDTVCSLGEGPLWHPDRQTLFWFDIDNKVMFEKAVGGQKISYRFDRTVSAAGLVDESKLIIASESDLFLFDLNTQVQRSLCDLEANNAVTRCNDGRADPNGGFWIGTMGFDAEANAGSIYRFYRGELRSIFQNISIPNSICFAPNRKSAFFTDSGVKVIWRVALDDDGWPASEPVEFANFANEDWAPDGAVCDSKGQLWSAQWMASRVAVYTESGELAETHPLPTSQATCPAFGGKDYSTLFVTSAGSHLPDELKGSQPTAGNTFMIEGVGTGMPESRVLV